MFRCGALWRRLRGRPQDPAYADTAVIPILQPGPLDRPARLLHPRQARRATARSHRSALWLRRALRLGLLGLAAAAGGAAWWARAPGDEAGPASAVSVAPPGRSAAETAASAPLRAPEAVPSTPAAAVPAAEASGSSVEAFAASAPASAGDGPAATPGSPRPARAPREAAARQRIAALQHEWQVAEAMRLRYRALHAQGLVDWEAWQARENEALRLRLQLQALGHPPPAASAR